MVARTPLDCAKDVPAMARFAMARSANAVVRFMSVSPFGEASKSDRLQFVKRNPPAKRAKHFKLLCKSRLNLRSKRGCERPPEGLAYEPLKNQRRLATRSKTQMRAKNHVCR